MGDTGSLALGGLLGSLAVIGRFELLTLKKSIVPNNNATSIMNKITNNIIPILLPIYLFTKGTLIFENVSSIISFTLTFSTLAFVDGTILCPITSTAHALTSSGIT